MTKSTKSLQSSAWAASITVAYLTLVTIIGELYAPLKNLLADWFSHHWIGKGVSGLIIFLLAWLLIYGATKPESESRAARALKVLAWLGALGAILILAFYIYEFQTH